MAILDNDDGRLVAVAEELKRTRERMAGSLGEIESALKNVMRRCDDDRLREFERDFRNASFKLKDFGDYLAKTEPRLLEKARAVEAARKH